VLVAQVCVCDRKNPKRFGSTRASSSTWAPERASRTGGNAQPRETRRRRFQYGCRGDKDRAPRGVAGAGRRGARQGRIGQAARAGRLTVASSPLNGVVRSLLTSPERGSFKPTRPRTSSNTLISQAFNNRTKMGVVRLYQRKGGERARKRLKIALPAGPRGSEECRKCPDSAGFRPARRAPKRMSRLARLAEGEELSSNPLL
jgi:hypothetical protein